jgi:aminotransferase
MSQPSEDTNSKAQASRVSQERDGDKAAMADISRSGGQGSEGARKISERAERIVARSASPYYAGWKEVARNPYDKVTNPEGCIQLGLAENMVSP